MPAPMMPIISTLSKESLGGPGLISHRNSSSSTSAIGGTANRALFAPVTLEHPYEITRMFWVNGGTVSGTIDIGIYTSSGIRIWSSGVVTQAVINSVQSVSVGATPIKIMPGLYYFAFSKSNATGTYVRVISGGVAEASLFGVLMQENAHPLPATATFVTTTATAPIMGITNRSFL
jgi:hypothetical protein